MKHSELKAKLEKGQIILCGSPAMLELVKEFDDLSAYCEELAKEWPDDLLPADIRNIRAANWTFAQQVHDLEAENAKLRAALK